MRRIVGLAAVVVGLAASVQAGPILGAISVSSSSGDTGGTEALVNMINQSGLDATFVSGVTDFDTFTTSTTHSSGAGTFGSAAGGTNSVILTFDLGAAFAIDAMALWQNITIPSPPCPRGQLCDDGLSGSPITQFDMFADGDNDFSNGTTTVVPIVSPTVVDPLAGAQIFAFGPLTTQFIHLRVGSFFGWQAVPNRSLSEVAWRQVDSVPEPATLLLFGMGLTAAGLSRFRRT